MTRHFQLTWFILQLAILLAGYLFIYVFSYYSALFISFGASLALLLVQLVLFLKEVGPERKKQAPYFVLSIIVTIFLFLQWQAFHSLFTNIFNDYNKGMGN